LLSLIHVVEWRACVTGDHIALSDHLGAELSYAALKAVLREPHWMGQDRRVS